jgi:hypothetical protein
MSPISIRAGKKALTHLHQHGLRAQDIAVIPAAAGGPKGLILQALDQWLFGAWLPTAPRERTLIGASIGAWRMAAACHNDPVAAFKRLAEFYCGQRYPVNITAELISNTCKKIIENVIGGHESEITTHPFHRLQVLTMRGQGPLMNPRSGFASSTAFAAAALANFVSRTRLSKYMERVVVGDMREPALWLKTKFDQFTTHFVPLRSDNMVNALLASGTLPFIMQPVHDIAHAPSGTYWDGGLVDYQLALPYSRLTGKADNELVLYPHFVDYIVPGWLDKHYAWRRAGKSANRDWLDNVILVSPTHDFVQTLPRRKLPDRKDFTHYGLNHDHRIQNWKRAIAESERLRDAFANFVQNPNLSLVQPI